MASTVARNLVLYPWLHVTRNALFWLPSFVLYFSSLLTPAEVLQLEAVYYLAVVGLEVPSGYASDRLGRRPTLLVATVAGALGSGVLAWGTSFTALIIGQVLLAAGRAFQSGTDNALLYDSLEALGEPERYAPLEAQALSRGYATLAVASLIGGAAATVDLRLGHGLTAAAGLLGVVVAWRLVEPPRVASSAPSLWDGLDHLRVGPLRWALGYAIAMTALIHVPYELIQPWLEQLLEPWSFDRATPMVAGVVLGLTMAAASASTPLGPRLAKRIGPGGVVAVSFVVLAAVTFAMSWPPHGALLVVVALRSVPSAVSSAVVGAVVFDHVHASLRATWMSLQSLAGRLAFAGLLGLGARVLGDQATWDVAVIQDLSRYASAMSLLIGLILFVTFARLTPSLRE